MVLDELHPTEASIRLETLFGSQGETIVREWLAQSGIENEQALASDDKNLLRGMFYAIAAQGELGGYLGGVSHQGALAVAEIKRIRYEYSSKEMLAEKGMFEQGLLLMGEYVKRCDYGRFVAGNAGKIYGIELAEGKRERRLGELFAIHQTIESDLKKVKKELKERLGRVEEPYVTAFCAIYERKEQELDKLLGRVGDADSARQHLHYLKMLYMRITLDAEIFLSDDDGEPTKGTRELLDFLTAKHGRLREWDRRVYDLFESPVTSLKKALERLVREERYDDAAGVRDRLAALCRKFGEQQPIPSPAI